MDPMLDISGQKAIFRLASLSASISIRYQGRLKTIFNQATTDSYHHQHILHCPSSSSSNQVIMKIIGFFHQVRCLFVCLFTTTTTTTTSQPAISNTLISNPNPNSLSLIVSPSNQENEYGKRAR